MKRTYEGISIIIALVALLVGLLSWLSPFNPVGNSPISNGGASNGQSAQPIQQPSTPVATSPSESLPTHESTGLDSGTLVFSEDFGKGLINNFNVDYGNWNIIDDGTGNMILESDTNMNGSTIEFVTPDLNNFTLEYKVKLKKYLGQPGSNNGYSLQFRKSPQLYYVLLFNQADGAVSFSYVSDGGYQWIYLTGTPFPMDNDTWYRIKVTSEGNESKAYVNGDLYLTITDSRLDKGRVAFSVSPNTLYQFDDVQISSLP